MADLKVRKRDGSLEKWNYDKLLASIGKAGLALENSEKIASFIQQWVKTSAEKGVILSTKIRDKVTEELRKVDPLAADSFESYKK